jgi:uncharacterized protein with NAD-binding domain and iron-sulfur cluster
MKKKIAILGGGLGSMTTATLLSEPEYQDQFDITVYQMGWRLGGKGASGRNLEKQNRIEEHGLHLWFGFYDNAFELIKRCYAENNRPLGSPLSTWNEAFKPCSFFVLQEHINDEWIKWALPFPQNDLEPGMGSEELSIYDYASEMARFALNSYETYQVQKNISKEDSPFENLENLHSDELELPTLVRKLIRKEVGLSLHALLKKTDDLFYGKKKLSTIKSKRLILLLEFFLKYYGPLIDKKVENNDLLRRLWIGIDLALTCLLGFLRDGVFKDGLKVINKYDYKEWLKRNGASPLTVNSAPVNAIYSAFFSANNTFEAGTAINISLKLVLKYRGAFYYRMQAGMGDTIFTPMYEVLKKRGVKFEFFHKVQNVVMSEDQQSIDSVEGAIQATLKNTDEEYQPLVDVKGLPCWPSMPLYDQLVQGDELKTEKINLESAWTPWKNVGSFSLKKGIDYDHIVLGIAIDALKPICADIITAKPSWQQMMDKMIAVPTQALQLWFKPDVAGLGWAFWQKELAFLSTYTDDPMNTWADMSDLIIRESWPDDHFPNQIAYYCNEYLQKNFPELPPPSDHGYPAEQLALMRERVLKALKESLPAIFPNAVDEQGEFRWDLLVDPENGVGEERLNSQYLRVNMDPTEHYVLSAKGSAEYRLKADESGFRNMTLTGDWIDNEADNGVMNGGYVEGTVLSGIKSSEAVIASLLWDAAKIGKRTTKTKEV